MMREMEKGTLLDILRGLSDIKRAPTEDAAVRQLYSMRFFGPFERVGEFVVQMTRDVVKRGKAGIQVRKDVCGNYGIVRIG